MAQIEGYFHNGYGVSIIDDGYGSGRGLYEIAILDAETGRLVYDTPIADDVIGWLTERQVKEIIELIKNLPPRIQPRKMVGS